MELEEAVRVCLNDRTEWNHKTGKSEALPWPRTVAGVVKQIVQQYEWENMTGDSYAAHDVFEYADEEELQAAIERVLKGGGE